MFRKKHVFASTTMLCTVAAMIVLGRFAAAQMDPDMPELLDAQGVPPSKAFRSQPRAGHF